MSSTVVAQAPAAPAQPAPPPALDLIDSSAIGQEYDIEAKLGEGTYGVVLKARNKSTGAYVAIKKLRLEGNSEGVPATTIREITLLQDLSNNPNIVHLLQVVCRKRRVYLIFELMGTDLRQIIVSYARRARAADPPMVTQPGLPLTMTKEIARQMLHALWSCHDNRVLHRDLKPGNVLVSEQQGANGGSQYTVKLADFGLARTFDLPVQTYTHEVVTLWYRAPEILLGDKHYTPAVDVWGVGCIVAEMITGVPLLRGEGALDQLNKMFVLIGTPTEETWPGVATLYRALFSGATKNGVVNPPQVVNAKQRPDWAAQVFRDTLDEHGKDFITKMLQLDPRQRPTVGEILEHPWLATD